MQFSTLKQLPYPPAGKTGWPWTEATEPLPKKMPDGKPWPKISIVTPSFNQDKFIEETIRSVLLQGYPNLEYIIIDGGSTDNSVEIIKKYSPWLTYWASELDRGQSHAINKGLLHCTGDIFNWINSDDSLYPGALRAIATAWTKNPGTIITGPVINFNQDGIKNVLIPNALSLQNFLNIRKARSNSWVWHQPGTYLPLAQVNKIGGIREDLHFSMDHILMIELLQICKVVYLSETLAKFRLHKNSKTIAIGIPRFTLERVEALRASKKTYKHVTSDELKEDNVSLLITCGALAIRNRQYALASKYLIKSILISSLLVIRELQRRNFFNRLIRKLGQVFLNTFKVQYFKRNKTKYY
ncbi:glycosyltransferase family 2 protein [Planctomycetota bacterium]